jgi:preprotein translocase subunit SecA
MVSKAITNAQVQTEGYNFDIRKHLVEYDDVVNQHREVIYAERKKILSGADLKANTMSMITDEIQSLVDAHFDHAKAELDATGLREDISTIFPSPPDIASLSPVIAVSRTPAEAGGNEGAAQQSQIDGKEIAEKLTNYAVGLYEQKEKEIGSENMRLIERVVMLRVIDKLWMEHLTAMEDMRQGIGLRAVGQQDPLVVYKREGRALFDGLLASIQHDVARNIYRVNLVKKEPPRKKQAVIAGKKVGRNDPCPCGSGKKYKHCCGRNL